MTPRPVGDGLPVLNIAQAAIDVKMPRRRLGRRLKLVVTAIVAGAVIGASIFLGLSLLSPTELCQFRLNETSLSIRRETLNWSVVIVDFPREHLPSGTYLRIRDSTGTTVLDLTAWSILTAGNWPAYKVLFEDNHLVHSEVCPGDRLILDSITYPMGSTIEILDGVAILDIYTLA